MAKRATETNPATGSTPQIPAMTINWLGLWTLYAKEVRRFQKVWMQTILAPMVTTLLFLAIFVLALGRTGDAAENAAYLAFLVPGLIMMAMVQNAFSNSSSSLIIAKIQGNIVDLLMPPLSAGELLIAFAFGAVTRGLAVGLAVGGAMVLFVPVEVSDWPRVITFALEANLMLALLGVMGGIWAAKFDHIAAVTNFIITPLSFLSGTFYSIERLPGIWHSLSLINPFFYMIDGFRSGFIGKAEVDPTLGLIILTIANLALWLLAHRMFASGYKLKA